MFFSNVLTAFILMSALTEPSLATPDKIKDQERVRLPLLLTPYHQVVVQDRLGKAKQEFRAGRARRLNLRAQLNQTNHFYYENWHIETIPLSWSKASQRLKLKLRISRVYGIDKSLEEKLGILEVEGPVDSSGRVYEFRGMKNLDVRNRFNQVVFSARIGKHEVVARGQTKPKPKL